MTDKQNYFTYTDNTSDNNDKIMENLHKQKIDGIDVSGCKNFSCGICEEENKIPKTINHFTADCRMYPNCYYKQLKRKEQECEELKTWFVDEQIDNDKLQQLYQDEHCDNLKLKQTLAETKEIAEKVYNDCDDCYRDVDTNCDVDCIDCTLGGKAKLAEQILQKISECEVKNEEI